MSTSTRLGDADFWRQPLQARMDGFAVLREQEPFTRVELVNPLMIGAGDSFYAVTRYADIVEISRRADVFCSGRGSISIADMPEMAMEFFGSFIAMDDPRHARLRRIVSQAFTPKRLRAVEESVDSICSGLIDAMAADGEADLVSALSAPFPLMVICEMMGIPRSEFATVLSATNVILGAGDPDMLGGRDPFTGILEAGATLVSLVTDLAEQRRKEPTGDLITALVHGEVEDQRMTLAEIGPFFILLAVAGNDTTRTATSLGMQLLAENPEQRAVWQADLDGVTATAVEEIVRMASPVVFMRRTVTEDVTLSGQAFVPGDKLVLFYGAGNRDPRVFTDPDRFDVRRTPNPHVGFGGPGPHFCLGANLARRELSIVFRQLLTRLPDIELAGDPVYLEAMGIPLVGGVKRLPVRFSPAA
ncbi:MAG TPA: cytochrome P450 [Mycobacteriales bacterium]